MFSFVFAPCVLPVKPNFPVGTIKLKSNNELSFFVLFCFGPMLWERQTVSLSVNKYLKLKPQMDTFQLAEYQQIQH